MFDLVIDNARICDGTGRPSFLGSLGVSNGRITHLGRQRGLAAQRTIDADGLVLAPGFIDPHTHYDAQVAWDRLLTSSPWHGVTTVVMGNCGVGVAPVKPATRDILLHDLVNVEAIPYDVMQAGIDWQWESYGDYLDTIDRDGLGMNIAGLVALTPLRHYVMGEAVLRAPGTGLRKWPACARCCVRPCRPGPLALAPPRRAITPATAPGPWPAAMPARRSWWACAMLCGTWAAARLKLPSTRPACARLTMPTWRPSACSPRKWSPGHLVVAVCPAWGPGLSSYPDGAETRGLVARAMPQVTPRPIYMQGDVRHPSMYATYAAWQPAFHRSVAEQMALYRRPTSAKPLSGLACVKREPYVATNPCPGGAHIRPWPCTRGRPSRTSPPARQAAGGCVSRIGHCDRFQTPLSDGAFLTTIRRRRAPGHGRSLLDRPVRRWRPCGCPVRCGVCHGRAGYLGPPAPGPDAGKGGAQIDGSPCRPVWYSHIAARSRKAMSRIWCSSIPPPWRRTARSTSMISPARADVLSPGRRDWWRRLWLARKSMRRAPTRARSQGGSYAVVRRPERLSTRLWEHGLHVGCHDIASPHSKAIPPMAAVPLQGHTLAPWSSIAQVLAACGWTINTACGERLNLASRQRVAAIGRRVHTRCQACWISWC